MSLKRLHAIYAAREDQPGEAVSGIIATTHGDQLVIDPSMTFEPELFERTNFNRATLSSAQPLAGVAPGRAAFQCEAAGRASGTNAPTFAPFLTACSFREDAFNMYQIGSITSGPFYHNEVVTQTGTSATGYVVHDHYDGGGRLYIIPISGTPNGTGVWTGGTSGATATPSTQTLSAGYAYRPVSFPTYIYLKTSGTDPSIGDLVKGQTSGATAVVVALVASTSVTLRLLDGVFTDGETVDNITAGNTFVLTAFSAGSNPAAAQSGSLTIAMTEDATYKVMRGARGTATLNAEIGSPALFGFDFRGLYSSVGSGVAATGQTYTQEVPPSMLGVTFLLGDDAITDDADAYTPRLNSVSFDFGGEVNIPRDMTESTGLYDSAHVTARSMSCEMEVGVAPEANFDFLNKLANSENMRLRFEFGTSSSKKFRITCPGSIINSEDGGDQNGFATRRLSCNLFSRTPGGTDADDAEMVMSYRHT